jgi:hypothetical protein
LIGWVVSAYGKNLLFLFLVNSAKKEELSLLAPVFYVNENVLKKKRSPVKEWE